MTRCRRLALLVALGTALCLDSTLAQSGSRLVVDNRMDCRAEIHVWRHDGRDWTWSVVTAVDPGHWVPVYEVHDNERFRAWLPARGDYRYHNVRLDPNQQDVWWIQ